MCIDDIYEYYVYICNSLYRFVYKKLLKIGYCIFIVGIYLKREVFFMF